VLTALSFGVLTALSFRSKTEHAPIPGTRTMRR
jgi:hypothetical protein